MPATTAAPVRDRAHAKREGLRCRVRLADGRVFAGPLAPERHRALQLGVLHEADRRAGRARRRRPPRRAAADHHPPARRPLPARRRGRRGRLAARRCSRSPHATPIAARRCSSPPPSGRRRAGDKHAVSETRFLWVDVDAARRAAGAVGVPRRAPVPPARRERRQRRASTPTGSSPSRCPRPG